MTHRKRTQRGRGALIAGLGLALTLSLAVPAAAQTRRGVQQRPARSTTQADRNAADRATQRQGQRLLDRFARRVGEALHLDEAKAERLLRELQESRAQRTRITAQVRAGRQELGQLIQETPADEDRIDRLMDEILELDVARVQIAVDEQRRLAEFLTPLQRARVIWLQQRLARQALERRSDRPLR